MPSEKLEARIQKLQLLQDGWYYPGSTAITEKAIAVCRLLNPPDTIFVAPHPEGGIGLESYDSKLMVEISSTGQISYLLEDHDGKETEEENVSVEYIKKKLGWP